MVRHILTALLLLAVMLWVGAYLYYRPAGMSVIGWLQPSDSWGDIVDSSGIYGGAEVPDALRDFSRVAGYYLFLPLNLVDRFILGNNFVLNYPFYW